MVERRRIAFIGNALPRRCGIATFTAHLRDAVAQTDSAPECVIVAMNDHGGAYAYPPEVAYTIAEQDLDAYVRAADWINAGHFDAVSLQHEYGIFGGEAGSFLLALLDRLTVPVVATLHTVLRDPNPAQRHAMDAIIARSAKLVVMAEQGREMLIATHGVDPAKIEVIGHGIPDFPRVDPAAAKVKLGLDPVPLILTFGLLAPNKGIERMIEAMPEVLAARPDAQYLVLGATHPNLVRHEGEAYRERLVARAAELGVAHAVTLRDGFVAQDVLLDHISACDVYVTPYLHAAQMTSGTLSYSFGLGKPVVSTPYWHAAELLGDGNGVLVPFDDAAALGTAVAGLLANDGERLALADRAYAASRAQIWSAVGGRYVDLFEAARRRAPLRVVGTAASVRAAASPVLPTVGLEALETMCDDVGITQHAVHSVPDRNHGYCVDDNARALIVACQLASTDTPVREALSTRFAGFINHAWNPDVGRFRNFMGFDRRWLEPHGSDDSHARTLWALGVAARDDPRPSRRRWAADLFAQALPTVEDLTSPRAWAFTILGLDALRATPGFDTKMDAAMMVLGGRLAARYADCADEDWRWFEDGLSYDNARLPQALLAAGQAAGNADWTATALAALDWLCRMQTAVAGHFRPIGSHSFGEQRTLPRPFDQQPLEATATISAALAALSVTGDARWRAEAERAFAWFTGANDLGIALVDVDTGSCRDGLHPDRANENRGAESVLAWLMSAAEMRAVAGQAESRPAMTSLVA